MKEFSAALLPDGKRLHLHHRPIDLVIFADTEPERGREDAFRAAASRFDGLLEEIVAELHLLRKPIRGGGPAPEGAVTRRMWEAVKPYGAGQFITPMAAVAGAVADTVMEAMLRAADIARAYVNNGGDISIFLREGRSYEAAISAPSGDELAKVVIQGGIGVGGMATSGMGGRSLSAGIADAVTVFAASAAAADAAATLAANAVDIPGHPSISRRRAEEIDPETDLIGMDVATGCGEISKEDADLALKRGALVANGIIDAGLISSAALFLRGESRMLGILSGSEGIEIRQLDHA